MSGRESVGFLRLGQELIANVFKRVLFDAQEGSSYLAASLIVHDPILHRDRMESHTQLAKLADFSKITFFLMISTSSYEK